MFKEGDVLKAKMDVAESMYEGCKGTTVYDNMMELARTKRFEIVGVTATDYIVRHLGTDPLVEHPHTKQEVHEYFITDINFNKDKQTTNEEEE